MLGDISYHKATLQSEGKYSNHIQIHIHNLRTVTRTVKLAALQNLVSKCVALPGKVPKVNFVVEENVIGDESV